MKRLIAFIFIITIVSCSIPETRIYNLHLSAIADTTPSVQKNDYVAFLSVRASKHLEQPYILNRTSLYEMTPSLYAKWEFPPVELMKNKITDMLTRKGLFKEVRTNRPLSSDKGYRIIVDLKDFSRFDDGTISYGSLLFTVSVRDVEGRELYFREFARKERIDERSYLSLAKALSVALDSAFLEMSADISKAVK